MEDEFDLVYVAYITLKDGRRIYAKQYGKKCFCLRIPRKHTDNT